MRAGASNPLRWLACPAAWLLLSVPVSGEDPRSSLLMVEGEVISVEEDAGEGGLAVVTVRLAQVGRPDNPELALAPRAVLTQIGFEVAVGDRLKARVFPAEAGPARVHKVLNLTRRRMVRIRSLFRVPLWDGRGEWQGGPCQRLQEGGDGEDSQGSGSPGEEGRQGADGN